MTGSLTSFDESVLETFPTTFQTLEERGVLTPVIALDELTSSLGAAQQTIVRQVMDLKPQDYGVDTPYAGELEPVPTDLVAVNGQQYTENGERKVLGERYVRRHIHDAYVSLNEAFMAEQPDRRLLIGSCYRSPAYQVVVFISWLINNYGGDIARTIRHASPPNYSQHTIASKAAIDFMTIDRSPSSDHPEDFKETSEYAWLRRHAVEFNFHESWQEGNEFGMRAEPWHWQFRP